MDGTSLTPEQEKLNTLKQVLPEVFAEGKVDWEKLKATLGEDINFSNERYVLNWAGKSEAFKVLQAPTTKTLVPAKDESVNFDDTEHIFIEGENLEVLKVLQKSYFGKVKMIYIDPPYNTGNDSFIYPDKFSETKDEYEKRVGDKDEEGYMTKDGMFKKNSKENGQYHSNWLNMMMPRLYLAKNLLKQDGVIFISIDDNEVHNLRLLMNEIFGEENFVSEIAWRKSDNQANIGNIARVKEYILLYAKNNEFLSLNKMSLTEKAKKEYRYTDKNGSFRRAILLHKTRGRHYFDVKTPSGNILQGPWMKKEEEFIEMNEQEKIYWTKGGQEQPYGKIYLEESEGQIANDFLGIEFGSNQQASLEIEELFNKRYFDFPKSTTLIKHFTTIGSDKNDLILDFFSGSGTTAHAVMELNAKDGGNRKCISVQLPEQCEEKSEVYKAGYKTIADIAKERIKRASQKIQEEITDEIETIESDIKKLHSELPTEETKAEIESLKTKIEELKNQDLGFKVLKLSDSNFKQWQQITGKDKQALEEQMKLFVDPVAKNATTENMVYELLLKSGKDLNSTIEAKDGFYVINETELVLILEKANQELIDAVIASKPQKVIALDKLFKGNDQLKTNASLQMKDAGIEFKTI
jgi:adenine-specific DNA-methyltransferase